MTKLSEQELIEEILYRFAEKRRMLEEQKRLTDELQDVNQKLGVSEALKSHFLSNIRNEINNPLTSILGLATNLSNVENMTEEKVRNTGRLIHAEAFSLNFQLKNIFCAADIEAGEAYPVYNKTDIIQVIESTIHTYDHLAQRKNVSIKLEIETTPYYFYTDSEKFALIISNLISNGIEFNNENSELIIVVKDCEDALCIEIIDKGIGISEEHFGTIFDRFTQVDTGTTKSHLGQGLGLSITKALLDLMNASIDIDSTLDVGSTFSLKFPKPLDSEIQNDFSEEDNEFLFDADESF